jgi:hypothetical protein
MYTRQNKIPYVIRDSIPTLQTAPGESTEAEWIDTKNEDIRNWYDYFADRFRRPRHEFLFKTIEAGFCESGDAKEVTIFVPRQCTPRTIKARVTRSPKRQTTCVCIAADGSLRKQFIVVDGVTGERAVKLMSEKNNKVHLILRKSAFMTNKLLHHFH